MKLWNDFSLNFHLHLLQVDSETKLMPTRNKPTQIDN